MKLLWGVYEFETNGDMPNHRVRQLNRLRRLQELHTHFVDVCCFGIFRGDRTAASGSDFGHSRATPRGMSTNDRRLRARDAIVCVIVSLEISA